MISHWAMNLNILLWWHSMEYYIYIYILHSKYLHNDIFRYMMLEITQDISMLLFQAVLSKLITLVVISTQPNLPVIQVSTATFLGVSSYSTGLEQLLKYQLGMWRALQPIFKQWVTSPSTNYPIVKISSVE